MAKTKGKSHKAKPARAVNAPKAAKAKAPAAKAQPSASKSRTTSPLTSKPTVIKNPTTSKPTVIKSTTDKPPALSKEARLRPSLPLPPPPPAKPEPRDELGSTRDVARLTRYGERFGAHKIDVRWLPLQLPITGSVGIFDPAMPKSFRVFERPVGTGQFRAMLSIAKSDDGKERLAALVLHVGRPPIARWTVAHFQGHKTPKSADQVPHIVITSGWLALVDERGEAPGVVAVPTSTAPIEVLLADGRRALALPCPNGEYAAYWATDAADKPICLVIDFDVFTQKEWKARPAT